MKDGLYIVDYREIYAAFVVENGVVTGCAPVLRNRLEFWKTKAKWYPTAKKILDGTPGEAVENLSDDTGDSSTPGHKKEE